MASCGSVNWFERATSGVMVAFGALAAASATVAFLQVPTLTIVDHRALREAFSAIDAVRELENGGVIVLDSHERALWYVDSSLGTRTIIGRNGSGPGEYGLPTRLIGLPGDRTLVFDQLNSRHLLLTGRQIDEHFVDATGAHPIGAPPSRTPVPVRADGRGRLYGQQWLMRAAGRGAGAIDTMLVLRWPNTGSWRVDTVARMALRYRPAAVGSASGLSTNGDRGAFRSENSWTVTEGGQVAMVFVDPYAVEWAGDATEKVRWELPNQRLRVDDALKTEWMEYVGAPRVSIAVTGSGANRQAGVVMRRPGTPAEPSWPEYMPPFLGGAVLSGPDETVWIRRTTAVSRAGRYDIVDGRGVARMLTIPRNVRIVGFGRHFVYGSRVDDDGLAHLLRFRVANGS